MLSAICNDSSPEEYTFAVIDSSGIFVVQDVKCDLWKKCVLGTDTFNHVCACIDYDWQKLKSLGFNANFLTRNRWLDIYVLTEKLHVNLETLIFDLNIGKDQIDSWRLSSEEKKALQIYGN